MCLTHFSLSVDTTFQTPSARLPLTIFPEDSATSIAATLDRMTTNLMQAREAFKQPMTLTQKIIAMHVGGNRVARPPQPHLSPAANTTGVTSPAYAQSSSPNSPDPLPMANVLYGYGLGDNVFPGEVVVTPDRLVVEGTRGVEFYQLLTQAGATLSQVPITASSHGLIQPVSTSSGSSSDRDTLSTSFHLGGSASSQSTPYLYSPLEKDDQAIDFIQKATDTYMGRYVGMDAGDIGEVCIYANKSHTCLLAFLLFLSRIPLADTVL